MRVNMNEKTIALEDIPQVCRGLGGRGLTSIMINGEVPPKCDPLEPENKLIFAPGLLSGTPLVNTSRISMGTLVLKAEREFNGKAGFTNQYDRLPGFFSEEPLPP